VGLRAVEEAAKLLLKGEIKRANEQKSGAFARTFPPYLALMAEHLIRQA
jgi:hypothetical protein